jgi:hypothetical protein
MTISSILVFCDFYDHQSMKNPIEFRIAVFAINSPPKSSFRYSLRSPSPDILLLLRTKSRCTNITPPQLNTQNLLHTRQDFLVWSRSPSLEVRHDTLRCVALGRQVFLRHLRLHLLSLLGDHRPNFLANSGWFNDIIAAIDFGEVLAFNARF